MTKGQVHSNMLGAGGHTARFCFLNEKHLTFFELQVLKLEPHFYSSHSYVVPIIAYLTNSGYSETKKLIERTNAKLFKLNHNKMRL